MSSIDVQQTSLEELLDRVEQIRPILERNGAIGDETRRVPDESIDALEEAGLFKLLRPRRYGGYEVPLSTFLQVGARVAEADGATGWLYTLGMTNLWFLALMSAEVQEDIWGENVDARLTGVLTASSKASRVDGGWRVCGKWAFASNSLYSGWAILGFPAVDERGQSLGDYVGMVPSSDWTIEDTWFVAGMRGTGSNTIVADDVFIPDHRTFSMEKAMGGDYLTPFTDEILYRSSFMPFMSIVLAAPISGMAKAALDLVISKSSKRGITYTQFEKQSESTAFQIAVAKAAMLSDSARLHMLRAAHDIDEAAARGEFLPFVQRARTRADAGYSTSCAREAIDILLTAHGAASFAEINPLQRIWRDASTAGRHAVLSPLCSDEIYGKALVGLPAEENITPLI